MTSPVSVPDPSPAAVGAFLRGIERRAAVLAELQAGDARTGDAAVATSMGQFRLGAVGLAMGAWPARFWSLLLTQPPLRNRTPVEMPLDATDLLGDLGAGPRAALLLRLAAGLDEATAAAVLGVPEPSYRLALQRALPHHADGRADPQAWQRLREQVHRRIKTLPPDRLRRLGSAREAALHAPGMAAPAGTGPAATTPAAGSRRLLLAALWGLLALCVMALAATYLPAGFRLAGFADHDDDRQHPATALPERAPASRYGPEAGLLAHRDFELLADPEAAQADDLAFHSWLAVHGSDAPTQPATAIELEREPTPKLPSGSETADAPD